MEHHWPYKNKNSHLKHKPDHVDVYTDKEISSYKKIDNFEDQLCLKIEQEKENIDENDDKETYI